ncbi:MAG: Ppx/GppA family phosphatase [Bacteroidetes bacterium]|nr:Ppx/GppA family phosphatase [Bacteroidota bacterium]
MNNTVVSNYNDYSKDKETIIAAIDLGTNSFHLIVVKVDLDGRVSTLARSRETIRLGDGSGDEMEVLTEESMKKGLMVLENFKKIASTYNAQKIRAVATSAIIEALNSNIFIELVRERTGIEIEIVSGDEEGRLTFLGVSYCVPINESKTMIVDIGGGSTETVIGIGNDILFTNSEKLGAVRLTQRFFSDGVDDEKIEKCRKYISGKFASVMAKMQEIGFNQMVGTAGTFEAIVKLTKIKKNKDLPEMLNGVSASVKSMLEVIDEIVKAKTPENIVKRIYGVDERRADIILAGALIVEYLIKYSNLSKIMYSPYGLREGIIYDTIQKLNILNKFSNVSELRKNTIYNLAKKYKINLAHAEHVLKTSYLIFDCLNLPKLTMYHRELLGYAAILHDIGYFISYHQHHKHSLYLIKNSDLQGFTNDEALLIANIARYHRKSHPKKIHEDYAALSEKKREIVSVLAGILRLSEGIDRRQKQLVKSIDANFNNNKLTLVLNTDNDNVPDIEIWGSNRRKLLLEEAVNIDVEVK